MDLASSIIEMSKSGYYDPSWQQHPPPPQRERSSALPTVAAVGAGGAGLYMLGKHLKKQQAPPPIAGAEKLFSKLPSWVNKGTLGASIAAGAALWPYANKAYQGWKGTSSAGSGVDMGDDLLYGAGKNLKGLFDKVRGKWSNSRRKKTEANNIATGRATQGVTDPGATGGIVKDRKALWEGLGFAERKSAPATEKLNKTLMNRTKDVGSGAGRAIKRLFKR